mgnify:CR=1 FL=1
MPTQSLTFRTITTPTTLTGLNTLSMINQSTTDVVNLEIDGQSTSINLDKGQTLELSASTGFTLPDINVSGTNLNLDIITS